MRKLNKQDVQNMLDHLKKDNSELKDVILHNADGRLGKRIALAREKEHGAINPLTDYMLCVEMNQFLRGYMMKSESRLNQTLN